jgi:hypothetical protein
LHGNSINGIGLYKWADGRKYFGEWEENNMTGIGISFDSLG